MKVSSKTVFSTIAFTVVIGLQGYIIHQQNQANISLEAKVEHLEQKLETVTDTNSKLLSKVERIENELEPKPRQLLSMN